MSEINEVKQTTTNLTALTSAIKLLSDAVLDSISAIQPGQSIITKLFDYENLIGDLESLLPNIGDIPTEVSQLQPEDYLTLVNTLVTDLNVTDVKAKAIITASLTTLHDIVLILLPDFEVLVSAIKS